MTVSGITILIEIVLIAAALIIIYVRIRCLEREMKSIKEAVRVLYEHENSTRNALQAHAAKIESWQCMHEKVHINEIRMRKEMWRCR